MACRRHHTSSQHGIDTAQDPASMDKETNKKRRANKYRRGKNNWGQVRVEGNDYEHFLSLSASTHLYETIAFGPSTLRLLIILKRNLDFVDE